MKTEKKITRGISKEFAEAFKQSVLNKLYEEHKDELLIGVRNEYLNLYYNCNSIAKVEYRKRNKSISCTIDKFYIDGNHYKSGAKEKKYLIDENEIINQYDTIKANSDGKSKDENKDEQKDEKKAQSKLVILNNQNCNSNWYCIDVEYVKQFGSRLQKDEAGFNARFDIIAVSKYKPHRVALIELKYGSGAIGGKSGVHKHVEDFTKFCEKGYFQGHLKKEIIDVLNSQIWLGLDVPFEMPSEDELVSPEFFFITLNNKAKGNASTPEQTMAGYLFNKKRWGCKKMSTKESVESKFGDITRKDNGFYATFLFSEQTLEELTIDDIIDSKDYKRILPA